MMLCSIAKHTRQQPDLTCDHDRRLNSWNGHEMCSDCYDRVRLENDASWKAHEIETAACPDCRAARRRESDRCQRTETIDPATIYGQHIPLLCLNHQGIPRMTWHTKNINAGRSIFFNGFGHIDECDCSARDLFSPGRFIYKLCYLLGSDNTYKGD